MSVVELEKSLSSNIRELAFVANNGELAWNRDSIAKAIDEIVGNNYLILGGEVWMLFPIDENIRLRLTSGTLKETKYLVSGEVICENELTGIYGWTYKTNGKNWVECVHKSAQESLNWIIENDLESKVVKEYKNNIYYNLTLRAKE